MRSQVEASEGRWGSGGLGWIIKFGARSWKLGDRGWELGDRSWKLGGKGIGVGS